MCYCGRYAKEHSIGDGCGNFTPHPAAPEAGGAEAMREAAARRFEHLAHVWNADPKMTAETAAAIRALPVPPAPALSKEQRAFYEAARRIAKMTHAADLATELRNAHNALLAAESAEEDEGGSDGK